MKKKLTVYLLVTSAIGVISLIILNDVVQRGRISAAETLQIQVENTQPQPGIAGPGIAEPALVKAPEPATQASAGPFSVGIAQAHAHAPKPGRNVTPVIGFAPSCIPDGIPHLGYQLRQARDANYQRLYPGLRVSWQYHAQKKPETFEAICLNPGAPYQLPYGTVTIHRR